MSNVVFYYKRGQLKVKNNKIILTIQITQTRGTVSGGDPGNPLLFGIFNNIGKITEQNGETRIVQRKSTLSKLLKGINPSPKIFKNFWIFCNNKCNSNGPLGYCFSMKSRPIVKYNKSKTEVTIPINSNHNMSKKQTQTKTNLNNSYGWIMLDSTNPGPLCTCSAVSPPSTGVCPCGTGCTRCPG